MKPRAACGQEKRQVQRLVVAAAGADQTFDLLERWHAVLSFGDSRVEGPMGQLIVRGLDDRLIRALKLRAARAGRSAEAEHRAILEQALQGETETFAEAATRLRARTPPQTTNSADLIRRDRDRDYAGANE
jgi:antitoxin FitA